MMSRQHTIRAMESRIFLKQMYKRQEHPILTTVKIMRATTLLQNVGRTNIAANAENAIQIPKAASASGSDIIADSSEQILSDRDFEIVSDSTDSCLPCRPNTDTIITTRTGRQISKPKVLEGYVLSALDCPDYSFDGVAVNAPN